MEAKSMEHAQSNADGHMAEIRSLVARLKAAEASDNDEADKVREEIETYPLSVEVRSGWTSLGSTLEAAEYQILLTTGGPALRIMGDLNSDNEPENARLEMQDWGTPWTEARGLTSDDDETLRTFAAQFYFGE